ncbi:MAG: hypothetical protein JRN28_00670 [Nitrososphaerota archaeon]|nr:hypothetical protein [Nitrososphaerota archaeon]
MLETTGDKALKAKEFEKAIASYKEAIVLAPNPTDEAEFNHKIALCYRMIGDFRSYYTYERLAADHYKSIEGPVSTGQSADFLKEAGDVLSIASLRDLSRLAYAKASEYFRDTSGLEEETDMQLAWAAWAEVCEAKSLSPPESKAHWLEAAVAFEEAARASEPEFQESRLSRSHQCYAMANLASGDIAGAARELNKARGYRKDDDRLAIATLAIDCLLALTNETTFEGAEQGHAKETVSGVTKLTKHIERVANYGSDLTNALRVLAQRLARPGGPNKEEKLVLARTVETFAL